MSRLSPHIFLFFFCLPCPSFFCPKLALISYFLLLFTSLKAIGSLVGGEMPREGLNPVSILLGNRVLFEVRRDLVNSLLMMAMEDYMSGRHERKGAGRCRKTCCLGCMCQSLFQKRHILPNEGRWVSGLQKTEQWRGSAWREGGCWQLAPVAGNWATHLRCLLAERKRTSLRRLMKPELGEIMN